MPCTDPIWCWYFKKHLVTSCCIVLAITHRLAISDYFFFSNIAQKNCLEAREDHHCQLKSPVLELIHYCIFLDFGSIPEAFHVPHDNCG